MLDPIIDTLESVAEHFRTEYRPGKKAEGTEGKFVLDVKSAGGWALENVLPLKNSLSNAKTERDQAKAILKELGDNFTVEQYKAAMGELEELKKGGTGSKAAEAAVEAAKTQLTEKYNKELRDKDAQLGQRDNEINELLITSEATRWLNERGGEVGLLLPHVIAKCKVVRGADGKPKAKVMQDDGKAPRMSMKQGSNADMEIDEFVDSLKLVFPMAFKGSGASGSGGTGGAGGQDGGNGGAGSGNGNNSGNGSNNGNSNGTGGKPPDFQQQLRDQRRKDWGQGKTGGVGAKAT